MKGNGDETKSLMFLSYCLLLGNVSNPTHSSINSFFFGLATFRLWKELICHIDIF